MFAILRVDVAQATQPLDSGESSSASIPSTIQRQVITRNLPEEGSQIHIRLCLAGGPFNEFFDHSFRGRHFT